MGGNMTRIVTVILALAVLAGSAWAAGDPAKGKELYAKKCKACHSIEGVGGPMAKMGGPLDDVGAKRDADWLHAYFKNPKSKIPTAKMPTLKLSDEEWNDVVAYMLTLKGEKK
jgi:cytochrome c2